MKLTREQVKEAVNKGYTFYGEFDSDKATEEIMKLLSGE